MYSAVKNSKLKETVMNAQKTQQSYEGSKGGKGYRENILANKVYNTIFRRDAMKNCGV